MLAVDVAAITGTDAGVMMGPRSVRYNRGGWVWGTSHIGPIIDDERPAHCIVLMTMTLSSDSLFVTLVADTDDQRQSGRPQG